MAKVRRCVPGYRPRSGALLLRHSGGAAGGHSNRSFSRSFKPKVAPALSTQAVSGCACTGGAACLGVASIVTFLFQGSVNNSFFLFFDCGSNMGRWAVLSCIFFLLCVGGNSAGSPGAVLFSSLGLVPTYNTKTLDETGVSTYLSERLSSESPEVVVLLSMDHASAAPVMSTTKVTTTTPKGAVIVSLFKRLVERERRFIFFVTRMQNKQYNNWTHSLALIRAIKPLPAA